MVPVLDRDINEHEKMAFDFFKKRSVLKLPGVFDSEFWETLVLQASSTEPAVLHALMALGAVHRSSAVLTKYGPNSKDDTTNPDMRLALQQYNKSIQHLNVHFERKDKSSLQVALITCMVFICIELLRSKFDIATTHLNNGLKLLHEMQGRGRPSTAENSLLLRSDPGSVDDYLIEAFTRLNLHSALFGQGSSFLYIIGQEATCGPTYEMPHVFKTPRTARLYLDGLMNGIYYLEVQVNEAFYADCRVPDRLVRHKEHLQASLEQWLRIFNACLPSLVASCNRRAILGLPVLRLYHSMATIMVSVCDQPGNEMVYDSHITKFASIVTQAVDLWQHVSTGPDKEFCSLNMGVTVPNFTVDSGFIPPLYYTAVKCRVPSIRRKAIDFILAAPHREGIWDGIVVAQIARRIMDIEEEGVRRSSGINSSFELSNDLESIADQPAAPESARLHSIRVLLPGDSSGKAILICRRPGAQRDGPWESKTVEFDCLVQYL